MLNFKKRCCFSLKVLKRNLHLENLKKTPEPFFLLVLIENQFIWHEKSLSKCKCSIKLNPKMSLHARLKQTG